MHRRRRIAVAALVLLVFGTGLWWSNGTRSFEDHVFDFLLRHPRIAPTVQDAFKFVGMQRHFAKSWMRAEERQAEEVYREHRKLFEQSREGTWRRTK